MFNTQSWRNSYLQISEGLPTEERDMFYLGPRNHIRKLYLDRFQLIVRKSFVRSKLNKEQIISEVVSSSSQEAFKHKLHMERSYRKGLSIERLE